MKNIVACIDHSGAAGAVCDAGAWVSQRVDRPLLLLHVLDRSVYPTRTDLSGNLVVGEQHQLLEDLTELDAQRSRLALEQGKLQLEEARKRAREAGIQALDTLQLHGHFVETLAERQEDIRILVMGRHGEDHVSDIRQIGSNIENVIRSLSCRILIVPPDFTPPDRVLFAYDASPTARKVLYILARSPLFKGLPFHVLMVGADNEERRAHLDEARLELEQQGHGEVIPRIIEGDVEDTLMAYVRAQDIGVLIMGAYGHSRIRQFLVGSTTTRLLRQSEVPVLLMRQ